MQDSIINSSTYFGIQFRLVSTVPEPSLLNVDWGRVLFHYNHVYDSVQHTRPDEGDQTKEQLMVLQKLNPEPASHAGFSV